jgi:hypothetical protein
VRRLSSILAAVAVAALLVACGSSSGPTSVKKSGTLSKPDWIAAADNICADALRQTAALPKPSTTDELVSQLDKLIVIYEHEQAELRKLVPEEREQAAVDAVVEAAGVQVTLARGLREAARTGDTTAIAAFGNANAAKAQQAQRVAQDYGLKVCGNPRG